MVHMHVSDRPGGLALGELLAVQAVEVLGGGLGEADPPEGRLEVQAGLTLVAPLSMTADHVGHGIPKPGVEVAADREPAGALAGEAVLLLVVTRP